MARKVDDWWQPADPRPGWDVELDPGTKRWTIIRVTRQGKTPVRRGRGRPALWWHLALERWRYPIGDDER